MYKKKQEKNEYATKLYEEFETGAGRKERESEMI